MPQNIASDQDLHFFANRNFCIKYFNRIALKTAKTPMSFGHSECSRVKNENIHQKPLKLKIDSSIW